MSKSVTSGHRFFERQSVFFALLVSACLLSALLIFAFWADSWTLWPLGFLLIAAWLPLVISTTRVLIGGGRGQALFARYQFLAKLRPLMVDRGRNGRHFSLYLSFLSVWSMLVHMAAP